MKWRFWEKEAQTNAGVASMEGKDVIINPTRNVSLNRLKARLKRVNYELENKVKPGSDREANFMRSKRKLELQIKLAEGDY